MMPKTSRTKHSKTKATLRHWVSERMDDALLNQVNRLRHLKDVKHVRLMADAHLTNDVCVGCVLATKSLIYPAAIGGDIGCGMLAVAVDLDADRIDGRMAQQFLAMLDERVPIIKHSVAHNYELPSTLSCDKLQHLANKDGALQLGTLGRGNHFLELQRCRQSGQLWLMIHTGSRGMGPAIRDHHLNHADGRSGGLEFIAISSEQGKALCNDMAWARGYAELNRLQILSQCEAIFSQLFNVKVMTQTMIHCDHNHLEPLDIKGETLLVHRKGASMVDKGQMAVIPGSMGSDSFHVEGKGNLDALCSSSHGAGRCMSRQLARNTISAQNLAGQIDGVFYQTHKLRFLTEEAPSSYKNIDKVMKAQKHLVKVKRRLSPILSYKGA